MPCITLFMNLYNVIIFNNNAILNSLKTSFFFYKNQKTAKRLVIHY
jgi:hypothetical protein